MKRLPAASAASAVLCLALSLAPMAAAKTTTIKMLLCGLYNGAQKWVLTEPIKDFERSNPGVKVSLSECTWDEITEKTALGVASGSAWDIVMTGCGTAGILGGEGLLLPLDSYIQSWKEKSSMYPAMWETVRFKGKTYGMPIWADPRGMVYNKQLFARMGLDPNSPPRSWEAILEAAKKGTVVDGTKNAVTQVGWTSSYPYCSHQDYAQFLSSAGGSLVSADQTRPTFNTAEGIDAAKLMTQLYQACNPIGMKAANGQDIGLFAQGKAAMCRGLYITVVEARKKSQAAADNIGFFPIQRASGTAPSTMSWVNALAISRGSKNPKLAFDFLKVFCSGKNLYKLNEILGSCSPRTDGVDLAEQNKALSIEWYRNLKHSAIYLQPREGRCQASLDGWLWKAWTSRTSPVQAIEGANKDWQRMLDAWWSVGKRKKQAEVGK